MDSQAARVAGLFAATVVVGIVLLVAFEPEVQTVDADELFARDSDARAFLIADYVFIGLYAVLSPVAIWRFGAALVGGRPPGWIKLTALLLAAAGIVDAAENTLLLVATASESTGTVDAAHALAIPKTALFLSGALLALAALVRAVGVLRART